MPDIYQGDNAKIGNYLLAFGVVMFLAFVGCAAFLLLGHKSYPTLSLVLGAAWVVLVPVYFFFEHIIFFRKYGTQDQYEQFKRVQDLAAKIWAAAILVLAAFYADTFPK